MKPIIRCVILLAVLFGAGCKESEVEPIPFGYEYFPVTVGHWVEYNVDSIVHNGSDTPNDTFSFRLREEITEEFVDLQGRTTYRLERFRQELGSSTWEIQAVWVANRDVNRAEKVEENERFIKLVFPVSAGNTWNGNAFNTLDEEQYTYDAVDESGLVGDLSFDSTLTVIQFDNSDPIVRQQYGEERYAKGVGLIYRKFIDIELQPDSGLDLTLQVTGFGEN